MRVIIVMFVTLVVVATKVAQAKESSLRRGNTTDMVSAERFDENAYMNSTLISRKLQTPHRITVFADIQRNIPRSGDYGSPLLIERPGFYACGMTLYQSIFDDYQLHARFHFCSIINWGQDQIRSVIPPALFTTQISDAMCPENAFIYSTPVQATTSNSALVALSGIRLLCRNIRTDTTTTVDVYENRNPFTPLENFLNYQRVWLSKTIFPFDYYIKGARTRATSSLRSQDVEYTLEVRNLGVSQAPINGFWSFVTSGAQPSYEISVSFSMGSGMDVTTEQTIGFSQQVEAGIDFGFFSSSVTVGSEQTQSIAASVSSFFEQTFTRTVTQPCQQNTGSQVFFVYQWVMEQDDDDFGPGFQVETDNIRCTTNGQMMPRCPLFFCSDNTCQTCLSPFETLSAPQ